MKNRTKFAGIIALVALIGFLGVSCDTGSSGDSFHAPNPTLPSLPMGELQDVPAHFWPAGEQAARFVAPTTPWQQQQVYSAVRGIATTLRNNMNNNMFLHSDVGRRDGGTLDFAAMPAAMTGALDNRISLAAGTLSGTIVSTLDAPAFFDGPASSGAATIRSSPQVQFQFNPYPVVAEGAITTDRFFGVVRANVDSRMNWNPNREWGTNNDGTTALVGFVIFTTEPDGSDTYVGGQRGGVAGVARVSFGNSSRFDGQRVSVRLNSTPLYYGVDPGRDRTRVAVATAYQVGFFNMDRSSVPGGIRNPELAPPAVQAVERPAPPAIPDRFNNPWQRAVWADWGFIWW